MMTVQCRNMAVVMMLVAGSAMSACSDRDQAGEVLASEIAMTAVSRADDPVVARVNDTVIYKSDVKRAAIAQGLIGEDETLSTSSNIFNVTVEELIDQRLLALDAVSAGMTENEEAQRRLAAARERILGNLRVETYLAQTVNDDAVRALYEAQNNLASRGEERRARQIVVADETLATDILNRLGDEEDFETLAAELSIDAATAQSGGELGWLSRDMLDTSLQDSVFDASIGDRVGPIEGADGWYVIEVLDRRVPNQRSFEDMREDIVRFMTFEAIDALMSDLREGAKIERIDAVDLETPEPEDPSDP